MSEYSSLASFSSREEEERLFQRVEKRWRVRLKLSDGEGSRTATHELRLIQRLQSFLPRLFATFLIHFSGAAILSSSRCAVCCVPLLMCTLSSSSFQW